MKLTKKNWHDVYRAKLVSAETMEVKGYTLIERLFVDSSGFGRDYELALSQTQFERKMLELLEEHGTLYATILDAGQFQVYIGLFKKTGKALSKRIANNTLEIQYPDGSTAYRLHNTDIVTYKPNGDIVLNTGGWNTVTTRARMNSYLPQGLRVQRRKGESFIVDTKNNSLLPLCDCMVLKGYSRV